MPSHLVPDVRPRAVEQGVVTAGPVRVSVLTSQLLRIEYSPDGVFEDRASFAFQNRELPVPRFEAVVNENELAVTTEHLRLTYTGGGQPFRARSLRCELIESNECWHYGDREWDHNLGGTIRTLDTVNGRVPLGHGLVSRRGWSVINDSRTAVLDSSGWFTRRRDPSQTALLESSEDLYFFGYGHEYRRCLLDFYRISGVPATIPRYALGVWWSRYWPYRDSELVELMERFQTREIPVSVSIVDMDWHLTRNEYTNGWTGYTWNAELFPDPATFLDTMHKRGVRVGLNLHPHDGIHPHEAAYDQMREAVPGDEPAADEQPVAFAPHDARFMEAYLRLLHRPLEEQGVDLWWIDWQQGEESELPGLDPLAALNHAHFLDLRRNGGNGLILSRYAGLGSHRYPVGFSGDSVATWESLAFQPELTATAANVGYGCWSHDIGGHMAGTGNPELYLRWVQFGVFSPVFRVHSSRNPYNVRLPWEFEESIAGALEESFKLRGRLIPYIHTCLEAQSTGGLPLCTPMYYHYPELDTAYDVPAQYMFGPDLLVAPVVEPVDPAVGLARALVWIPPGEWYHLFSGERFSGPRRIGYYCGLRDVPVFVRSGALIPMQPVGGSPVDPHPAELDLVVAPGNDHSGRLIEEETVAMRFLSRQAGNSLDIEIISEQSHRETGQPGVRHIVPRLCGFRAPREVEGLDGVSVRSGGHEAVHLVWDDSPVVEPAHLRARRAHRLLLGLNVPDTVKRTIGARLDTQFDLRALAGLVERMSPVQARALVETVGGHAFEDVLLAHPEVRA